MKNRFQNLVSRFRRDVRGGIALMTGLTFPVIFLAAGGAVDYARTITDNQQAQKVLDSVVLTLTKLDPDEVNLGQEGRRLFARAIRNSGLRVGRSDVRFRFTRMRIEGSATIGHETTFLRMIGVDMLDSTVSAAAVPPGTSKIEIALVLDVSGSMGNDLNGSTRIAEMISSVNGMFDTLEESLEMGTELSVAVVPYSSSVNLSDYRNALENFSIGRGTPKPATDDVWAAERLVASNGNSYIINDSGPQGRRIPLLVEDEMRKSRPYARLAPLDDDIDTVRSKVNSLVADGWTAGHIGMAWGLYTLSPKWKNFWPQPPAKHNDAKKIIVMLSDGQLNTTFNIGDSLDSFVNEDLSIRKFDRLHHQTNNALEADAYFQDVCEFTRDEGITIFTVALNLSPVSEAKMRNCAEPTGKLFSASSASDLKNAFESIARAIGERRLDS